LVTFGPYRAASAPPHAPTPRDQAEQLARTPGCERLAALLRRKDCAALRKADLITLARAWGYKSCIWVRKRRADSGAGAGGGAGAATSARAPRAHADAGQAAPALLLTSAPHAGALALASAALRERTGTRHDALAAYLAANLVPMCAVARTAFQGRAVRAPLLAAAASGRLQLPALAGHTARVQAWHPVAVSFGALVRAQHAAVAARLTALDMAAASGADDEADVPAWRALAATAAPGEEEFRTLYTMHSLGDAAIDEIVRSSNLGDEVESVWAHEAHSGHVSSLELASAAGALLAHAKMGPLREYVRTAAALLELLTCYLNDCLEALGVRAALLDDVARAALAAAAPPTPPFSEDGGPKTAMAPGVAAALALAAMPPRPCTAGLPPPGQAAAGSHFLRIWQSLMFHGVRPGLTA
jgi:hypothetical protein